MRYITASGRAIWAKTYVLDISGTREQFVAYSVDITQLIELQQESKLQEIRLRNVIEGTNAGTWEWDVLTGEVQMNARGVEILGYSPADFHPLHIDELNSLIHPDDRPRSQEAMRLHFLGDKENYDFEGQLRRSDGHWVWVHDRGKVVEWSDDGEPLRVAGTHMDITERKQNEAKLLVTNEALSRSNVELEQFAYVASHDLQEPLRMVASFTQLLEKNYGDRLDETAREYIGFAVDGAKRMQDLIKDLLSYSRLGRDQVERHSVDLNSVLERVLQSFQFRIEESGAVIKYQKLPRVHGDSGQLMQLLQNLIGNALKYHGNKEVLVEIGTQQRDAEQVFYVRDNGIGIDPQFFDRIFEIFQRLHTRAHYSGTGIGLAICKRIVAQHRGHIWVESEPGNGSVFYFTLGLEQARQEKLPQVALHT